MKILENLHIEVYEADLRGTVLCSLNNSNFPDMDIGLNKQTQGVKI